MKISIFSCLSYWRFYLVCYICSVLFTNLNFFIMAHKKFIFSSDGKRFVLYPLDLLNVSFDCSKSSPQDVTIPLEIGDYNDIVAFRRKLIKYFYV